MTKEAEIRGETVRILSPAHVPETKQITTTTSSLTVTPPSSFPNIWKYPVGRDKPFQSAIQWLEGKRETDYIGNFWRVHDKLYDLTDFIERHPGGRDWIAVSRGTDVTEAFEEATTPRNAPYTFHENGFYKTLKRKAEPILREVGSGSTREILGMQDATALTVVLLGLSSVYFHSIVLMFLAGLTIALCVNAAHNFFHVRDTWRRFYWDIVNHSIHVKIRLPQGGNITSTCSDEATRLGSGQKVISFSFYVKNSHADSLERYIKGVTPNLERIEILYPGWVVRIYTNDPTLIPMELLTKFKFVYCCDVNNIPGLGDMSKMHGMTWRALALGDPFVDIFNIRDLDSRPSLRERMAVSEFEFGNFSLHAMRDHPYHGVPLLGASWGASNIVMGPSRAKDLQRVLIEESLKVTGFAYGKDQHVFASVIYNALAGETLAHDSYFCGQYPREVSRGFPTQRVLPTDFVANVWDDNKFVTEVGVCPEKCRKYPSWTSC